MLRSAALRGVLLAAARLSCRVAGGQGSPEATARRPKGLDRSSAGWNLIREEDVAGHLVSRLVPDVSVRGRNQSPARTPSIEIGARVGQDIAVLGGTDTRGGGHPW
jgi:hypothetical protein